VDSLGELFFADKSRKEIVLQRIGPSHHRCHMVQF
jgi:hypothetical protein